VVASFKPLGRFAAGTSGAGRGPSCIDGEIANTSCARRMARQGRHLLAFALWFSCT